MSSEYIAPLAHVMELVHLTKWTHVDNVAGGTNPAHAVTLVHLAIRTNV